MDGIIIVDKPPGWTSFDVVAKIRNLTGVKKAGHSGTLDPMATGLLPVFLGRATKSIQYFLNGDKGYEGEMVLGVKTDTGDAEGKILMTNDQCPINTNEGMIIETFKRFTGEIEQVPPMYSAVKVNGKRLYELARQGIEVERKPRRVVIYKLELLGVGELGKGKDASIENGSEKMVPKDIAQLPNRLPYPYPISFSVVCSKGTYIRQLAVDIGDELGCGAHLSALRRTYSHPFHISQAVSLQTVSDLTKIGRLEQIVLPVESFVLI